MSGSFTLWEATKQEGKNQGCPDRILIVRVNPPGLHNNRKRKTAPTRVSVVRRVHQIHSYAPHEIPGANDSHQSTLSSGVNFRPQGRDKEIGVMSEKELPR